MSTSIQTLRNNSNHAAESRQMPPGQMPPGQMPSGQMAHGQMAHGQMSHGQMSSGQMAHGQMSSGQMAPGQMSSEKIQDNSQQPPPEQVEEMPKEPLDTDNQNADALVSEILSELDNEQQQPDAKLDDSDITERMSNNSDTSSKAKPKSLLDNIINGVKLPLAVGLIILVLSIPAVTDLFSKILPQKELITNNIGIIVAFIKGLLGAVLYFIASRFV